MTFDEDPKAYGDVSSIAEGEQDQMERAGSGAEGSINHESQS